MRSLLIGCGRAHHKKLKLNGSEDGELVTLDINPEVGADVVHDLEDLPYPFDDGEFDEIHAYEVLEHTGQQGDFHFFFGQFGEFYRILKPGGHIVATCPSVTSRWLWGDPSHKRVISPECLVFLNQREYERQVGKTAMTDFRYIWKGDFETVASRDDGETFTIILRKR